MTESEDQGLERSCGLASAGDRYVGVGPANGVELLQAWFGGHAFDKHRHDTYAIGVTDSGAQAFSYRGEGRVSSAGEVMVLHPDEAHDGHAESDGGFSYRMLYIEPALISDAVRALCGRPAPLPFVDAPVIRNGALTGAVRDAFVDFPSGPGDLATDDIVVRVARALLAIDRSQAWAGSKTNLDIPRLERARAFLDAEHRRVVRTVEIEAITGLSRYELARQFRRAYGTSPYRYLLMRRLDHARAALPLGQPLADLALDLGFADQAHFTRAFKAAFGLSPARHRTLLSAA